MDSRCEFNERTGEKFDGSQAVPFLTSFSPARRFTMDLMTERALSSTRHQGRETER